MGGEGIENWVGKGFSIYVRCKDNEKVTRKVKKARNFLREGRNWGG